MPDYHIWTRRHPQQCEGETKHIQDRVTISLLLSDILHIAMLNKLEVWIADESNR